MFGGSRYYALAEDSPGGFYVSGVLPVDSASGVHSLTDVPVYSFGPGHEYFRGIQNSVDIAFHIAKAVGLGKQEHVVYGEN